LEESNTLLLKGGIGSGLSFRFANIFKKVDKNFLFICENKEKAAYFLNDIEVMLGDENTLFFPASYRTPYESETIDNANVLLRSEVLTKLNSSQKKLILVTYPEAIFEKIVSESTLKKHTIVIKKGDTLSLDFINELLFEYNFKRVDFVSQPGEFSVRGGIIDVFSFANQHPYRIEFYDDSVDSLRSFDVESQLSIESLNEIKLLPNTSRDFIKSKRKNIIELFKNNGLLLFQNIDSTIGHIDNLFNRSNIAYNKLNKENKNISPEILFTSKQYFLEKILPICKVLLQKSIDLKTDKTIHLKHSPQATFNKKFELLIDHLNANNANGYKNYIFCSSIQQADRFRDIFNGIKQVVHYKTMVNPIHEGFEDVEAKISCFTDHQIFERYHKFKLKSSYTKKNALTLKELTHLELGDYVSHIDHGIGSFGGLQKIDVDGSLQEVIKLIYADRDILYVSIHSLHKISKFRSKDGQIPKIHKLGSAAWKNLKIKTKSKVKEIAFNLIELYAKRKQKIGYACNLDSYLQVELEASFLFEDTPDQIKVTDAVKSDMQSDQPMDRLICGDVGFGKTEIAVRAAFKAVDNGKQVVILVPTTILAFQHFKTFSKRLENFPVTIDYLNRFRSSSERKIIIENLKNGKIDLIIGTHQIVGKEIEFKDLGLLIVDEEQKFGVSVKEKLRALKANVDVLTLTATPIPRTLQFSLMAARDLSLIENPPPNRYPIDSTVVRFDEKIIRDSILYEMQRGGQVYFIHNRVENIKELSGLIQRLVPDAKIRIGHGQMNGKDLERNLLDFMDSKFDVLVATTIIENGLDVSNANTILINNANNFGLSDLHQMRGRVGRSNKKAFCYFITPPYNSMSKDAQKRIQAIEQYAKLGAGLQIAMKDLEIRGAGDLLGGEQSGFINEIGFETYQKILQEAINELKENEFKSLYSNLESNTLKNYVKEIQIETDLELFIPDYYVNIVTERLNIYNKLSQIKTEIELINFEKDLKDRFGSIPDQVIDLLDSIRLKWKASKIGIEKLILKKNQCRAFFISDQNSNFFQSSEFSKILSWVQKNGDKVKLKEKETKTGLKLLLVIKDISNIQDANEIFSF